MIFRLLTVAAGVWLIVEPSVLGYGDPAATNHRLVGPTVAGAAFVAIWAVLRPVRWVAAPLGVWLLLSPFLLGYSDAPALWSSLITGVVILLTTLPGQADPERFGGGWRSLLSPRPGVPD